MNEYLNDIIDVTIPQASRKRRRSFIWNHYKRTCETSKWTSLLSTRKTVRQCLRSSIGRLQADVQMSCSYISTAQSLEYTKSSCPEHPWFAIASWPLTSCILLPHTSLSHLFTVLHLSDLFLRPYNSASPFTVTMLFQDLVVRQPPQIGGFEDTQKAIDWYSSNPEEIDRDAPPPPSSDDDMALLQKEEEDESNPSDGEWSRGTYSDASRSPSLSLKITLLLSRRQA